MFKVSLLVTISLVAKFFDFEDEIACNAMEISFNDWCDSEGYTEEISHEVADQIFIIFVGETYPHLIK